MIGGLGDWEIVNWELWIVNCEWGIGGLGDWGRQNGLGIGAVRTAWGLGPSERLGDWGRQNGLGIGRVL